MTRDNPNFRPDQTGSLTQGYSFTPVRHHSPAVTRIVFAQATDGGGRWSALLESVLGATPREFESRILRHVDLLKRRLWRVMS